MQTPAQRKFLILGAVLLLIPVSAYAVTFTKNLRVIGNLTIVGALSKGSGTFVIDHPLDPLNKLLYHSFVESPTVTNIYDGVATFDGNGEAVVALPDYWHALNGMPAYQWTAIGRAMPNIHVKTQITEGNNSFVLGGGVPGGKVSWQVTGIRHDPYILANPVINEVPKSDTTPVKKGECLWEPLCE